jgi:hypothetical protein
MYCTVFLNFQNRRVKFECVYLGKNNKELQNHQNNIFSFHLNYFFKMDVFKLKITHKVKYTVQK